ncbi:MAG: hypothetical protein M1829_006728 [Trizodia sp. TS-e1964]|nr:MAG: hypothetical protein M1829_006728 [Trizodia sp. TS-e1964]
MIDGNVVFDSEDEDEDDAVSLNISKRLYTEPANLVDLCVSSPPPNLEKLVTSLPDHNKVRFDHKLPTPILSDGIEANPARSHLAKTNAIDTRSQKTFPHTGNYLPRVNSKELLNETPDEPKSTRLSDIRLPRPGANLTKARNPQKSKEISQPLDEWDVPGSSELSDSELHVDSRGSGPLNVKSRSIVIENNKSRSRSKVSRQSKTPSEIPQVLDSSETDVWEPPRKALVPTNQKVSRTTRKSGVGVIVNGLLKRKRSRKRNPSIDCKSTQSINNKSSQELDRGVLAKELDIEVEGSSTTPFLVDLTTSLTESQKLQYEIINTQSPFYGTPKFESQTPNVTYLSDQLQVLKEQAEILRSQEESLIEIKPTLNCVAEMNLNLDYMGSEIFPSAPLFATSQASTGQNDSRTDYGSARLLPQSTHNKDDAIHDETSSVLNKKSLYTVTIEGSPGQLTHKTLSTLQSTDAATIQECNRTAHSPENNHSQSSHPSTSRPTPIPLEMKNCRKRKIKEPEIPDVTSDIAAPPRGKHRGRSKTKKQRTGVMKIIVNEEKISAEKTEMPNIQSNHTRNESEHNSIFCVVQLGTSATLGTLSENPRLNENNGSVKHQNISMDAENMAAHTNEKPATEISPPTVHSSMNKTPSPSKPPPRISTGLFTEGGKGKVPEPHSPINGQKVAYRVGLSKRARIAPLLRIVKK